MFSKWEKLKVLMACPQSSKRRQLMRSLVDALGFAVLARHFGGGRFEGEPLTPKARAAASKRME